MVAFASRFTATRSKLTDKDTGNPRLVSKIRQAIRCLTATLRQGLSVDLQQSPFLNLVSDAQVQRTLTLMGQPKDTPLTPEIAQQACEANRKRRGSGRLHRKPGKPICPRLALRTTLLREAFWTQEQTVAARRRDVLQTPLARSPEQIQNPGGRIAWLRWKSTPRPSPVRLHSSLEDLQHRNGKRCGRILRQWSDHTHL